MTFSRFLYHRNSKSNLSLPTATTEATLLLGLLKNKINSNVNSASTSSCSTTSGPMSGGSSNPARNDISRPVEINQLVEKYTKQVSHMELALFIMLSHSN